jgi:hypothetical protein
MVPLASETGEGLERSVPPSALVEQHAELADSLLPLMIGVTAVAVAQWWLNRRSRVVADSSAGHGSGGSSRQRAVSVAVAVVALLVSVGTLVQVGRIGHSGAKAVWSQVKVSGGGSDESGASRP